VVVEGSVQGKGGGLEKVGGMNLSTSGSSGPFCAALPNVNGRILNNGALLGILLI
jgi:hypothetical protein